MRERWLIAPLVLLAVLTVSGLDGERLEDCVANHADGMYGKPGFANAICSADE
jgi:hypothetical protein